MVLEVIRHDYFNGRVKSWHSRSLSAGDHNSRSPGNEDKAPRLMHSNNKLDTQEIIKRPFAVCRTSYVGIITRANPRGKMAPFFSLVDRPEVVSAPALLVVQSRNLSLNNL